MNTQIKTEEEYNLALSRINDLFDSLPGSKDYDEAKSLITLVEIYERRHYKVEAPDKGIKDKKREPMKLISKTRKCIISETYEIQLRPGMQVTLIDYLTETGKVIDTVLRDKDGNDLSDDPVLFESVIEFIEGLEQI